MEDTSDDEKLKIEFLSRIQARIWSHALSVRISEIVGDSERTWKTATGVLVRVGGRLLAITAWHVVERFVQIRESAGLPVLILGNLAIAEPRSVFLDKRNDLIVLEVPHNDSHKTDAIPYQPSSEWPPARVSIDDAILIVGFPALLRSDEEEILHGDLSFFGSVESVSEQQFVMQLRATEAVDAGSVPFPEPDADLGGMSGAPAFVIHSDAMQLVGIFSQSAVTAPVWIIRSLAHLPSDLPHRTSSAL